MRGRSSSWWAPFLTGLVAGGLGATLLEQHRRKRQQPDPRLIKWPREGLAPVVVIPGIMGSGLIRPDGTRVWLSWANAVGSHALALPCVVPLRDSRDDLIPNGLLGTDALLPRLFGFTEYADLIDLLRSAGFAQAGPIGHPTYHVFSYDWRRDLIESAEQLGKALDRLAEALGDPSLRFNLIGHSMGGLIARHYLRYGGAEPGGLVDWAGARRIRSLALVATPSGGSIPALEGILHGNRVGLSTTTLAASVVSGMPAIYELLPPAGAPALLDHRAEPVEADLLDVELWRRERWGPFGDGSGHTRECEAGAHQRFIEAALARARAFHAALARKPETPCPVRVVALGGDCLPTLARAVMPERPGPPRFTPVSAAEAAAMYDAGDGRVTRASVLASHLGREEETGCGIPEVAQSFFGGADHHGIYAEPTFQSILLRLLLQPSSHGSRSGSG